MNHRAAALFHNPANSFWEYCIVAVKFSAVTTNSSAQARFTNFLRIIALTLETFLSAATHIANI